MQFLFYIENDRISVNNADRSKWLHGRYGSRISNKMKEKHQENR